MNLEERIRRMVEALPSEASVTLPAAVLQQWLEEAAAEEPRADSEDELVSQVDAAEISGYSCRRIRELEAEGRIVNYGEKHRPLYRRGELPANPRRPNRTKANGYDPAADARELLS